MWRNSALVALALLAACDNLSSDGRSQRAGDVKVRELENEAEASETPVGVGAPTAWRVAGLAAAYGADGQAPMLAIRCDRAASMVTFERPGGGTAITLAAGGLERTMEAQPGTGDRVQSRLPIDDELVARMAAPQSQLLLVTAAGERVPIPGGVAMRRVVEACRAPAVVTPPVIDPENAVAPEEGALPVPPPVESRGPA
ncbi:MAG TPA: hypothetical protein VFP23_09335 [Solirubrobacterales bacterium]|nr:hypothetical protein [Solirubrobacterales bacterium]